MTHTSVVQENVTGQLSFKPKPSSSNSINNAVTNSVKIGNGKCTKDTSVKINVISPQTSKTTAMEPPRKHFARLALPDDASKKDTLVKLRNLMTRSWGLEPPKMILSFVGGQKDIRLDANNAAAFRDGIINLVKRKSNIWIFSGGTQTGN